MRVAADFPTSQVSDDAKSNKSMPNPPAPILGPEVFSCLSTQQLISTGDVRGTSEALKSDFKLEQSSELFLTLLMCCMCMSFLINCEVPIVLHRTYNILCQRYCLCHIRTKMLNRFSRRLRISPSEIVKPCQFGVAEKRNGDACVFRSQLPE